MITYCKCGHPIGAHPTSNGQTGICIGQNESYKWILQMKMRILASNPETASVVKEMKKSKLNDFQILEKLGLT